MGFPEIIHLAACLFSFSSSGDALVAHPPAAVLIVYTEGLTRSYYASAAPSVLLQLANAFKVGLEYGLFVDAFKLST